MDIPDDLRHRLLSHLGISSDDLDEAVEAAVDNKTGVTPFLRHTNRLYERIKADGVSVRTMREREKTRLTYTCTISELQPDL